MAVEREVTLSDITRAIEQRNPQLADLVIAFLDQADPPENAPEEPTDDDAVEPPPLPADAWTLRRLRQALGPYQLGNKTPDEQRAARREAWEGLMAAPFPPPRLRLGEMLVDLYENGDEVGRAALTRIFARAKVGWGLWKALKTITKRAEERHDANLFGVLAWRLDAMSRTPSTGEVGKGTLIYMQRRAWRYLRQLGQAVPEVYPQFAVQVLRHYPADASFGGSWVANQIWGHTDLIGQTTAWFNGPPEALDKRAFDDAWKVSPDPLLRLVEDAGNDRVCQFAIRSLRADFPTKLREADPRWIARIGAKPLTSVHEFVVDLFNDSPELHQSKLAGLGLHDTVLGFLHSKSQAARTYAIEYARAHAPSIPVADLVELVARGADDARDLALSRLQGSSPQEIGLPALVRLLATRAGWELAGEKFRQGFQPSDLDSGLFVTLATGARGQRKFLKETFAAGDQVMSAGHLRDVLADERCDNAARREALGELGKRDAREIGIDWIKEALLDSQLSSSVAAWLRDGKLAGPELDVEWVKGLLMRPSLRSLGIAVLGNPKLVEPRSIGLSWLLAMARQTDETLSGFAHRYLLENFAPADFAREGADVSAGLDRLWALASGADEPEPVRRFAATYLKVHHPVLGPTLSEAQSLGIAPKLTDAAYALARVRPLFFDLRADVRRLAVSVGRFEMVRWNDPGLLFDLAAGKREGRVLAAEALLHIGEVEADTRLVPPADWLSASRVFGLAESSFKATREMALTLVRRHYVALGGAGRLAWLMESPDREVRLFAVRLLWDRHRPRGTPEGWRPAKGNPVASERFATIEALRQFVRTVMFGLPPGRMERRELGTDGLADRPLPASVAKQRLIELVRDLAVEEREFADLVVPILEEFAGSQAKGEWQGCVAALSRIRCVHPAVVMTILPPPVESTVRPESRA